MARQSRLETVSQAGCKQTTKKRFTIIGLSVCLYVCLSVSVSVCLLVRFVSPAKMAQPIKMPFGGWLVWVQQPRNHSLDGGQGRTNPSATASGDKAAMRPFVNILWPLVIISLYCTAVMSWSSFTIIIVQHITHRNRRPLLAGTRVKNWIILLKQSFTAYISLLTPTSIFGVSYR